MSSCCLCVCVHTHTSITYVRTTPLPKSVVSSYPPSPQPVSLMVLIYFGAGNRFVTRGQLRLVLLLLPPTTYIYISTRADCNPLLLLSSSLLFFRFFFFFLPIFSRKPVSLPRSLIIIRIPPVWIFPFCFFSFSFFSYLGNLWDGQTIVRNIQISCFVFYFFPRAVEQKKRRSCLVVVVVFSLSLCVCLC